MDSEVFFSDKQQAQFIAAMEEDGFLNIFSGHFIAQANNLCYQLGQIELVTEADISQARVMQARIAAFRYISQLLEGTLGAILESKNDKN